MLEFYKGKAAVGSDGIVIAIFAAQEFKPQKIGGQRQKKQEAI